MPQRDSYASAPFLVSYKGRSYGSVDTFEVMTPVVLVYGGVYTSGGAPPVRSSSGENLGHHTLLDDLSIPQMLCPLHPELELEFFCFDDK